LASTQYPNDRWRKFLINLLLEDYMKCYRPHFAHFLYQRWQMTHGNHDQFEEIQIIFMSEMTRPINEARETVKFVLFDAHVEKPTDGYVEFVTY
jgi:hypothetical protein